LYIVNLFADKTQGLLTAVNCGLTHEGVKTKQWDLIKDGHFEAHYQAIGV